MWLALLFIHVFGLAGFNLILRKSVLDKVDRFTLATVMQTGIAIPAVFIMILRPPELSAYPEPKYYIGFFVEVILTISLQIVNVKALQYLEASVYPVFYNLRILITAVLGILFLGEEFIPLRILGGLMIFLAIVIVRQKGSKLVRTRGVEWGITAALVISFLNLNEKIMIDKVGILNFWVPASITAAILMWTYLLLRRKKIEKSIMLRPRMIQLMVLRAVSGYSFPLALAAGALLSVASYISSMSVIIMVVFGVILLGERDYLLRKLAATTVAVFGLTIILITQLA